MMNFFRSLGFLRAVVFLLSSMVLHDSVITRDQPPVLKESGIAQVIIKAADEHDSDDWEGRFLGLEHNLCKGPVYEIEFTIPYSIVKNNFSNTTSLFKSVPSELPSPPPKG
jgi:hypothetical protein|nr:MAG: hypothetical protein DIU61_05300 [Bacteroidota bacterium]